MKKLYAFLIKDKSRFIAAVAIMGILVCVVLRYGFKLPHSLSDIPLYIVLTVGGVPLVWELLKKLIRRDFGSDLLAGIAIVTAVILGEYLAGSLVVLMLSGGEALESLALKQASSVLSALAKRMPSQAHLSNGGAPRDIPVKDIQIDNIVIVYPHETCPVDGVVVEGHGSMDESYLTGEPFHVSKTVGATVMSGAINGNSLMYIRATKRPEDSRYAKIMEVIHDSENNRPKMRRLADNLGAFYTPLAVSIAIAAWAFSGESTRFLSVLVIATPCPLLIAIPITIIGAISLCAKRSIIVRDPMALEQIDSCRTAIFDKTGTLTYGTPQVTDIITAEGFTKKTVLAYAAGLEQYSKHPLAHAVLNSATENAVVLDEAQNVSEEPGKGLVGEINGKQIVITSRKKVMAANVPGFSDIPLSASGLECLVLVDGEYAGLMRFHDAPRADGKSFISHLAPKHQFTKIMIVSGDRESEVRYLADKVGISTIYAQMSPEEKLEIVREETEKNKTLYVGDGINDAPAMVSATVGISIGQSSDVTTQAAEVVVMDNSLIRIDEFMHISRHMKKIALQSAIGGMLLSVVGMGLASAGYISPVAGALCQEVIDVLAILNALRAARLPATINDVYS